MHYNSKATQNVQGVTWLPTWHTAENISLQRIELPEHSSMSPNNHVLKHVAMEPGSLIRPFL